MLAITKQQVLVVARFIMGMAAYSWVEAAEPEIKTRTSEEMEEMEEDLFT
jgi:hypothetical protein